MIGSLDCAREYDGPWELRKKDLSDESSKIACLGIRRVSNFPRGNGIVRVE
jgi:hypothetical protein